ncbi:hypothetical protein FZC66_14575 [Priestia megaterium]|nr:hypothetical protein FZC66_14575 [Priestia megaterium]
MSAFNPQKFSVTYRKGSTPTTPFVGRHYTLTHSEQTDDLFLWIDDAFATDQLTEKRNELFAEWLHKNGVYVLYIYVFVGNEHTEKAIQAIRYTIFKKEMPTLLTALRYGDATFFQTHPTLDQSPIYVHFHSNDKDFHTVSYLHTPSCYVFK